MSEAVNDLNGMHGIRFEPDKLKFSVFTSEEIKKLSVAKVLTPLTFDSMGHPIPGGLHDTVFGPITDRNESCKTCGKNIYNCPGHFGYIELPLPVTNPLFHKFIAVLLKMTCFSCFRLQLPIHSKKSLELQIKLVDSGYSNEALQIESILKELIAKYKSLSEVPEEQMTFIRDYEKLIEQSDSNANCSKYPNKTTEFLKNSFVSDALKEYKIKRICMECHEHLKRMQFSRNKLILHPSKKQVESTANVKLKGAKNVTPTESRQYMRKLWDSEKNFLKYIMPLLDNVELDYPTDALYMDIIPVTPNNLRPVSLIDDRMSESSQTELYKEIMQNCMCLRIIIEVVKNEGDSSNLPDEAKGVYALASGNTALEKLKSNWELLQSNVDNLLDYTKRASGPDGAEGLKQIIEKKQGIMRQNMMGKRVNFSARSVIAPDPNVNIDEIGIPEAFAKNLTYPVPVTSFNVAELRKMVLNGPDIHPGANMVEFEDGSLVRINPNNLTQKEGILKRLLTPDEKDSKAFRGVKKVHRHLCNGDILLANRQPTLHKPSIMAHTARILKTDNTIKMHYANCKAYNADFDGDEMNVHFPQNEIARSEAYNIVHVSRQYLVPKDGTPLSGLIQDHMVAGVKMTMRGKFFNKTDYQNLVFQALSFKNVDIVLLPPAIIKPQLLWSGKQIISTIIINIVPKNKKNLNLAGVSKIPFKMWETSPPRKWRGGGTRPLNPMEMTESQVIIRDGQLLVGVLDKMHYGATPYGLVHCMYELYGGPYAIKLLNAFGKVFISFLQVEGFTLGVRDILVLKDADEERDKIIRRARKVGPKAVASALDLPAETSYEMLLEKLQEAHSRNANMTTILDRHYKTFLDDYTNNINKVCLPAGLVCKFPENNLQLMVQSGAKGSTVNTMQISCLLGQIELEGKRPPVMISGKSLPSFPTFEFAPRAGGFIEGRFLTGIKPQEFFFHCMAGREGLIDTAVKTSRSGYLQRCLIKHLEGLTVNYDLTVRDSDKSVVQFLYGEDGFDVCKSQFFKKNRIDFLLENTKVIVDKNVVKSLKKNSDSNFIKERVKEIDTWKEQYGNPLEKRRTSKFALFSKHAKRKLNVEKPLKIRSKNGRSKLTAAILDLWHSADEDMKQDFDSYCKRCPNPLNADFQPDVHYGALNEFMKSLLDENKLKVPIGKERKLFEEMISLKSMQSLCPPGEPVGILAAQSIGEPSTQMTLNTFHFAGRGEMNVTLGIPRLREILMMASKNIKTPSMEIPFKLIPNLEYEAEKLRKKLTRVTVENVLEKIEVTGKVDTGIIRQQLYKLKFNFLPHNLYEHEYPVKPKQILKSMNSKFFGLLFAMIKRYSRVHSTLVTVRTEKENQSKNQEKDDDYESDDNKTDGLKTEENDVGDDSENEEVEDVEDAKLTSKYNQVHDDQEPEDEEKVRDESSEDEDNEKATIVKNEKDRNDDENEKEDDDEDFNNVTNSYYLAQDYRYDRENYRWCELTFGIPLKWSKIDLTAILRECAAKCILHETPGINRAITYVKKDKLTLRTDGINIIEIFKYNEILDLNKLYCNDIHKTAEIYGIEAAGKVLVQEVTDVFEVYGIKVDPRHLSLIADYMTSSGVFEPLNRKGLENSASPFQQMSFEASLHFLKGSTVKSREDHLTNPSSCLIVGKPCLTGTGIFSVKMKIPQGVK